MLRRNATVAKKTETSAENKLFEEVVARFADFHGELFVNHNSDFFEETLLRVIVTDINIGSELLSTLCAMPVQCINIILMYFGHSFCSEIPREKVTLTTVDSVFCAGNFYAEKASPYETNLLVTTEITDAKQYITPYFNSIIPNSCRVEDEKKTIPRKSRPLTSIFINNNVLFSQKFLTAYAEAALSRSQDDHERYQKQSGLIHPE